LTGFFIYFEKRKELMRPFYKRTYLYLPVFLLLFIACRKEKLHWQKVERIESHTTDRLNNILFIDNNIGFVVGGQRFYTTTILTTNDGGGTWQLKNYADPGKGLYSITQRYDSALLAIGFEGKLMSSTDNGQHWDFYQLSHWEPYKDLAFIEPGTGILVGGISFSYGVIGYIGLDNKTFRFDTTAYELNDIQMVNNHVGYISGCGVILKTTDNAVSWQLLEVKNDNFMALHAMNEKEVWICGYNGSIYHTTDGGANWEQQRNGNSIFHSRYRLLDILFLDAKRGWAVGEEGLVIYTNDGGGTWKPYEHFTDNALRCVYPTPDGNLLVAGDNGTLYKLWL
jgi:photosystem II stability/assembly factor-like uncharacterized protein